MGKQWKQWLTLFSWAPKLLQMVTTAMKLKDACSLEEELWTSLDSVLKSWDITLSKKICVIKAMVFLTYERESRTIKKAECQRIDAFDLWCWRRLLRVPWTLKEIKCINPKGNQSWIFTGWTDAEAEAPILWPLEVKSRLTRKDPNAGKDWRQEEKEATEDEMAGRHHRLNGHESEQAPGDGGGQGSQACCSPWGHKELDMTEQLNK